MNTEEKNGQNPNFFLTNGRIDTDREIDKLNGQMDKWVDSCCANP